MVKCEFQVLSIRSEKEKELAKEQQKRFEDGMNVNLGLGIPTIIPNYLPKNIKMTLHGENGIFRIGSYP